jgi:hypothetical protein
MRYQQSIHFVSFLIIFLTAAYLRINTFWLSHVTDDEFVNIALAIKLDKQGMKGYNLYQVDYEHFSLDGKNSITESMLAFEGEEGGYLRALRQRGIDAYHQPLHYIAPGFPFLIMVSQKTIGGGNGYFISSTQPSKAMIKDKPPHLRISQMYAVLLPFAFSLLLVLLTYFAARFLFGPTVGLIAASIMAINPVSIFVSQKIWVEEVSLVFLMIALLFILSGYENRSWLKGLLAGIVAGIAVLMKQSAGIFLFALIVFYCYDQLMKLRTPFAWKSFFFNPFMLMFSAAFLALTAWWFALVFRTFGNPFYFPVIEYAGNDVFYTIRENRPASFVLFSMGLLYLSPLFLFAFGMFHKMLKSTLQEPQQRFLPLLFLWVVVYFVMMAFVFQSKEHRHMIAVYPALAISAAYVIGRLHAWLKSLSANWRWLGADEMLIILLLLATRWSTALVMDAVMQAQVLLLKPF